MRSLIPATGDLTTDEVDAAYAWPDAPWLRVNMVETLDGAAQAQDGLSRGIATAADARLFGVLRGRADALLIGAGTLRAERYQPAAPKARYSEVRAKAGQRPAPVIAVVSRSLALDVSEALFTEPVERPVVLTTASADRAARRAVSEVADVIDCGEDEVDLNIALEELRARGLTWLHCEGGPTLLAQLAAADLVDEWCVTLSPKLAGGSYPDGTSPGRILSGLALPDVPRTLELNRVLEEAGTIFLSYLRKSS
jgi:riboflavin biosynthesis pyrimidine reductase